MFTIYPDEVIETEFSHELVQYSSAKSFISKIKSFSGDAVKKTVDFLKKPETKIASLVGYWASEMVITVLAVYAFIVLSMYGAAAMMAFMMAFLSYSTFGVIGEAIK